MRKCIAARIEEPESRVRIPVEFNILGKSMNRSIPMYKIADFDSILVGNESRKRKTQNSTHL